ncbi:IclR family transcriptional regulator [Streptacidiphilus anmyonensis]|uniref:IclR family transcriptional regulator n=1 Tax=Streptacidiphilus anmyonensis TaxID=405782 RepID=UPI0005A9D09F|nr:IclR family transcriptional regulator [Streptacidiphilus anmyonensis]
MSQSVDRALTVLASLADGPVSLEQAAALLGVHKSTALRLLRTLEQHGFVHRQADYRYRLGGRLFSLAQLALESLDVRQVAAPHLAALNDRCGHTVHLAVYEDGEATYVDKLESRYPVRMYSRIGKRAPLAATAVGKVLLAGLPPAHCAELVGGLELPKYTPRSVRTREALLAEVESVRRQGWAVDRGEYEEGVNCVAVPVHGIDGRVIAACSISTATVVAPLTALRRLLPDLQLTAEAISREYGGGAG